jgi:HTH-type transcriptional regulator, sugar sensing transcriptional regulator
MNLELLRKIGLTEGEIRVYSALLSLGSSKTGKIMKKSGISSSKIYLILEKLIHKGLVSYISKNNVKHFQITNPKTILDYVDKEKQELDRTKEQINILVPEITSQMKKEEEESAQIYKGVKGIRVAYFNILNDLKKGEEYCFFAISLEEAKDKQVMEFISNFHKKRVEKGIRVRVISGTEIEELYQQKHTLGKYYKIKHHKLTLPVGVVIGKDRIINMFFGTSEPTAHEIISKEIAKKYQNFFDKIWKIAKN